MTELPATSILLNKLQADLAMLKIVDPVVIGIHTGGAWLAKYLAQRLYPGAPQGEIDISFYRDDFSRIGLHPQVRPSHLPVSVDDRTVVLVDDVLQTGRTIPPSSWWMTSCKRAGRFAPR